MISNPIGPPAATTLMSAEFPLRGRDDAIDVIDRSIGIVTKGRGAAVLVEGGAGSGKTRLMAEAKSIAQRRGLNVGVGQIPLSERVVPMSGIIEALANAGAASIPAELWSLEDNLSEHRYRLLEEIESSLERLALEKPLLLGIDDIHCGSSTCCAVLRAIPVRLASVPIVWIITYRPGQGSVEVRSAIQSLVENKATILQLSSLDKESISQILADMLKARPAPGLLEMVEQVRGNAFLLVELIRGLQEDGLLQVESGTADISTKQLPARIGRTVKDRLALVSPLARKAIEVASLLGGPFSFDQLSILLDKAPRIS